MARFRLLTPDAQYQGDAIIERRTAGPDAGRAEPLVGDRLIVTPHAAWSSPESVADARRLAVETAMLYLRDGKLRNLVNAPRGTIRAA